MIRPERKARQNRFTFKDNAPTVILLTLVFVCGLALAAAIGFPGIMVYILLWAASYAIIYAGTCRYCTYCGTSCPIPAEGSCVHRFFDRKETGFGYPQLFWAAAAYGLRIAVPVAVIIKYDMLLAGILYFGLLAAFWIFHLRICGCPNCVNMECPLNPDHSGSH